MQISLSQILQKKLSLLFQLAYDQIVFRHREARQSYLDTFLSISQNYQDQYMSGFLDLFSCKTNKTLKYAHPQDRKDP